MYHTVIMAPTAKVEYWKPIIYEILMVKIQIQGISEQSVAITAVDSWGFWASRPRETIEHIC